MPNYKKAASVDVLRRLQKSDVIRQDMTLKEILPIAEDFAADIQLRGYFIAWEDYVLVIKGDDEDDDVGPLAW